MVWDKLPYNTAVICLNSRLSREHHTTSAAQLQELLIANTWSKNAKCGNVFRERKGRGWKRDFKTWIQQIYFPIFLQISTAAVPLHAQHIKDIYCYSALHCLHSLFTAWEILKYFCDSLYFPSFNYFKHYSYNISLFLIQGEDDTQSMSWLSFFSLKPCPKADWGFSSFHQPPALLFSPTTSPLTTSAASLLLHVSMYNAYPKQSAFTF